MIKKIQKLLFFLIFIDFFVLRSFCQETSPFFAACFIQAEKKTVFIQDVWTKKWSLPGGLIRTQESPSDKALQSAQEQLGIPLILKQFLTQTSSGILIYECRPHGGFLKVFQNDQLPIPVSSFLNINQIMLLKPESLSQNQWQFDDQKTLSNLIQKTDSTPTQTIFEDTLFKQTPRLFQTELKLIQAFQNIQNPFWNGFFKFFSFLGGEGFILILLPWLTFAIHQRKGLELVLLLCNALLVHSILKQVFGIPRPFHFLPSLQRASANGFGFPSGHTLSVTLVWTWLALYLHFPGRWLMAILIALLGGLSRSYLGVHFFHDLFGGWILGLSTVFLHRAFLKTYRVDFLSLQHWAKITLILGIFAVWMKFHPETVCIVAFLGALLITLLWFNPHSIPTIPSIRDAGLSFLGIGCLFFISNWFEPSSFIASIMKHIILYFSLGSWVAGLAIFRIKKTIPSIQ